jgi:hypothetical protein
MKMLKYQVKFMELISKPVNLLFGSDEKGWFTLTLVTGILYLSNFPDAAIITAVYSTIFAYSGMQKYRDTDSSNSSESNDKMQEIEEQMEMASSMLEQFQEETPETEGEKNE